MIAVILLIAFLITGCEDKSVKTDHIIRIGVVTYTQDDPFINAMTDQLKENMTKTETVSASMWFWKEKPVIRMPSCAPNIL